MTLQSYVKGGSGSSGCSRHPSKSDFVLGKWSLPKSESEGGKDCISCAKNSARSPSRLCIDTYSWPKSATLFWSVLIFFPCLDVVLCRGFLKSAREFLLIGSWMEWLRTSITFFTKSWYCFLPVSTKVCNAATTDSSAPFRLSRVTRSGKSSKKGLPIRLMVSQIPSTCLWKVFCDARPCSWWRKLSGFSMS